MRRSAVVAAFLCILLVPALGFANGVPWPDWKDSDLTLWAKWNNTLGVPTEWGTNPGPLATPGLYAWPDGPGLRIDAFNYNNLNPLKKGWVLLAISIPLAAPSLYASSTYDQTVGILEDSGYLPDAQKYFYIWTFELEPNPCYERILIDFLSNATVGGDTLCAAGDCTPEYFVALATQCVVPIPGAIWLFGAGLLGLVGFRKKFKK